MLVRGVGDAREGGRRCSRGGSAMLVRGDLQGHRTHLNGSRVADLPKYPSQLARTAWLATLILPQMSA